MWIKVGFRRVAILRLGIIAAGLSTFGCSPTPVFIDVFQPQSICGGAGVSALDCHYKLKKGAPYGVVSVCKCKPISTPTHTPTLTPTPTDAPTTTPTVTPTTEPTKMKVAVTLEASSPGSHLAKCQLTYTSGPGPIPSVTLYLKPNCESEKFQSYQDIPVPPPPQWRTIYETLENWCSFDCKAKSSTVYSNNPGEAWLAEDSFP